MITVIIPYTGNREGLTALLVGLQPQLTPEDDIYIIDSSKDRSGLKIAALYATTRSYVFVEIAKQETDQEKAEMAGFQSMRENNQEGALVIGENVVVSHTFISNLKKAIKLSNNVYDVLVPQAIVSPYEKMDSNFSWFNPVTTEIGPLEDFSGINNIFYVTKDGVDKFYGNGNTFTMIGGFANEKVMVFPYKRPLPTA